jgi:septum formation protein
MGELHLLLASRSPRRRELLGLLGFPFEVMVPNVPERPEASESLLDLVTRLSRSKAHQAANECGSRTGNRGELVLACDTVVISQGGILGKPSGAAEAKEMLRALRGRVHHVYTAFTLVRSADGPSATGLVETKVGMRDYTDEEIAAYVASGDPLDKAGAYGIQDAAFRPAACWDGCYANVVGLPLCHLARCLEARGHTPPANVPAACQAYFGQQCTVYERVLAGPCPVGETGS